jgi:hypothetical protein
MNTPHRRKEWLEFKDWCGQRKLKPFPAHAWTVSAYVLWLEANRRYRTLHKRLDVIARVHMRACVHSPTEDKVVERTLAALEKRRLAGPHKSFDGVDLLQPKKGKVSVEEKSKKRRLRQTPVLVSKRPQADL